MRLRPYVVFLLLSMSCAEVAIELCDDGVDNNGDGSIDCADAFCADTTTCLSPVELCNDGIDNNSDGLTDCQDAFCAAQPICQNVVELCGDGLDNDNNGLTDCEEAACGSFPECQTPSEVCNDSIDNDGNGFVDCQDTACSGLPACQAPSEVCNDSIDNNSDGLIDCQDTACSGLPACQAPSEVCNDNLDNDGNGLIDCQDTACSAFPACLPVCGDGTVNQANEDCDGNDLSQESCVTLGFAGGTLSCSSACVFVTTACTVTGCGNNIIEAGELCDDGNTLDGDGCSSSCITISGNEVEPNNSNATADIFAIFSVNGKMFGRVDPISPSSDLDVYRVEIVAGGPSTLRVETLDAITGGRCVNNVIDTEVDVRNEAGTLLANSDDEGVGFCSLTNNANLPPGFYFVTVRASDAILNNTPFDYTVSIQLQ